MKHSDFKIGTVFNSCTGQRWQCTDVGSRTILAIELKPELESSWFAGPPYPVVEMPFDEIDISRVYQLRLSTENDLRKRKRVFK